MNNVTWSYCVYLQSNSYFTAQSQGYSTLNGEAYHFIHKSSSLAWRFVDGVVILDNYDDSSSDTKASFLFEIATIDNVKFSDDSVCTKHNKGHLLATVLVLTMALVIVHEYATAI